jgi:hypothetical protein
VRLATFDPFTKSTRRWHHPIRSHISNATFSTQPTGIVQLRASSLQLPVFHGSEGIEFHTCASTSYQSESFHVAPEAQSPPRHTQTEHFTPHLRRLLPVNTYILTSLIKSRTHTVIRMCLRGTCPTCSGSSWWGCGKHVPSIMDSIPDSERYVCLPGSLGKSLLLSAVCSC